MNKTVLGLIAVIIIAISAAVYYWNHLDILLQESIQQRASTALGTTLHVDAVRMDMQRGTGVISKISVASPSGFTAPHIINIGAIRYQVDTDHTSVYPITIEKLVIQNLAATYETDRSGDSNVRRLLDQINTVKQTHTDSNNTPLKLIIKKLIIESARAEIRTPDPDSPRPRIRLAKMVMHNVGKSEDGVSVEAVARLVTDRILGNMRNAAKAKGIE